MTTNQLLRIPFEGAELVARAGEDHATALVALKPMVEAMGLDWAGQFTKIKAHPVLKSTVEIISMVAEDGRAREMSALPLSRIGFWLATVNANKVSPTLRDRIIAFQDKAADAISAAMFPDHGRPSPDLGAMINAAVHLAMLEREAAFEKRLTERLLTDQRAAVIDALPALEMLKRFSDVGPTGRRPLATRVRNKLLKYFRANPHLPQPKESRETGKPLFNIDAARVWFTTEEWRELLAWHHYQIARKKGAGLMEFKVVPGGKATVTGPVTSSGIPITDA